VLQGVLVASRGARSFRTTMHAAPLLSVDGG
jgi:hypothetical protein